MSNAAAILGRKGGSARSEAQNDARRANGKRGGRPVKLQTVAGVEVHADAEYLATIGGYPVFKAGTPTAARWLARHGYVWSRDRGGWCAP